VVNEHLVEVGELVVEATWVVTPDKYAAPREFDSYRKAGAYADETSGRHVLRVSLQGDDDRRTELECSPLDEGGEVLLGATVVRRGFRVDNWRWGESFPTADEAYLSVPDGQHATLCEELWLRSLGLPEVRVTGPQYDFTGGGGPTWLDGWGGVGDE
jgi:hypothetical protein